MRKEFALLLALAGFAMAGCNQVAAPSGPPPAGTAVGPASPTQRQLVDQQPHSDPVSAGTAPQFTGTRSEGRPTFTTPQEGTGTLGGAPSSVDGVPLRATPRPTGGGG